MAVEDTQESQWQAIFDKVKKECPDKKHVPHRHEQDEPEKAKAHFTVSTSQRERTSDGATCLGVSCSFTNWRSSERWSRHGY